MPLMNPDIARRKKEREERIEQRQYVEITRIDVPIGDLVGLMVKAAIALVPAAMVVGAIVYVVFAVLGGALGSLG